MTTVSSSDWLGALIGSPGGGVNSAQGDGWSVSFPQGDRGTVSLKKSQMPCSLAECQWDLSVLWVPEVDLRRNYSGFPKQVAVSFLEEGGGLMLVFSPPPRRARACVCV